MQRFFQLTQHGSLQPGLGFRAAACRVENSGGQWVRFPDCSAWVPPYHRGAVVAFSPTIQNPRVDTVPPAGALVQDIQLAQIGQPAELIFTDAAMPPVAGVPVPVPPGFTVQYGYTQNGVPATDPYVLSPTQLNAPTGLTGTGTWWDITNITGAFQVTDLVAGTLTIDLDVGVNNPPLGGWRQTYVTVPVPVSGIVQQNFAVGQVRVHVPPVSPGSPVYFSIRVRSAGGGSLSLTRRSQVLDLNLATQLALI